MVERKELLQEEDIVTLVSTEGTEIDFIEIAWVEHAYNVYAILQPVELLEGMRDDEALVFKVTRDESGNGRLDLELDEEIVDGVFTAYYGQLT